MYRPGQQVVFIDGNPDNLDPANLRAVSKAAMLQMNRTFRWGKDADLNTAKLNVSELRAKMYERKKQ